MTVAEQQAVDAHGQAEARYVHTVVLGNLTRPVPDVGALEQPSGTSTSISIRCVVVPLGAYCFDQIGNDLVQPMSFKRQGEPASHLRQQEVFPECAKLSGFDDRT